MTAMTFSDASLGNGETQPIKPTADTEKLRFMKAEPSALKYGLLPTKIKGVDYPDILAVAVQDGTERLEPASFEEIRSESRSVRREFNPDPRVADFVSGEDCYLWWMDAFH